MRFPRYKLLGEEEVCLQCGGCRSHRVCSHAKNEDLRQYGGVRITNDGNDCALQVAIDSHSHCSYGCSYCFSENSFGHTKGRSLGLGQTSLRMVESIFSDGGGMLGQGMRKALGYDRRNAQGFPSPVQLGAINDPCDSIERQQGWLLRFIKLAIKYNQPVRISTKGTVLLEQDYQREISKAPHLFWVLYSIVTPDEELAARIERFAPPPKERLRAMRAMSDLGVWCGLRFRPVIPGASDSTPRYRKAYATLIDWAAEAGAKSISYEVLYAPMRFHGTQIERWADMERACGVPVRDAYKAMGKAQASLRPSAAWTEDIVHAIYGKAKSHGMVVGVSEPAWKDLNDDGCCCGMMRTHPVFGNWEPRNATAAIVNARDNGTPITLRDVIPDWMHEFRMSQLCAIGATGPKGAYAKRHLSYADWIRNDWTDQGSTRNPVPYFQGMLIPEPGPEGSVQYRYRGQNRRHPQTTPYWRT